eukprot:403339528
MYESLFQKVSRLAQERQSPQKQRTLKNSQHSSNSQRQEKQSDQKYHFDKKRKIVYQNSKFLSENTWHFKQQSKPMINQEKLLELNLEKHHKRHLTDLMPEKNLKEQIFQTFEDNQREQFLETSDLGNDKACYSSYDQVYGLQANAYGAQYLTQSQSAKHFRIPSSDQMTQNQQMSQLDIPSNEISTINNSYESRTISTNFKNRQSNVLNLMNEFLDPQPISQYNIQAGIDIRNDINSISDQKNLNLQSLLKKGEEIKLKYQQKKHLFSVQPYSQKQRQDKMKNQEELIDCSNVQQIQHQSNSLKSDILNLKTNEISYSSLDLQSNDYCAVISIKSPITSNNLIQDQESHQELKPLHEKIYQEIISSQNQENHQILDVSSPKQKVEKNMNMPLQITSIRKPGIIKKESGRQSSIKKRVTINLEHNQLTEFDRQSSCSEIEQHSFNNPIDNQVFLSTFNQEQVEMIRTYDMFDIQQENDEQGEEQEYSNINMNEIQQKLLQKRLQSIDIFENSPSFQEYDESVEEPILEAPIMSQYNKFEMELIEKQQNHSISTKKRLETLNYPQKLDKIVTNTSNVSQSQIQEFQDQINRIHDENTIHPLQERIQNITTKQHHTKMQQSDSQQDVKSSLQFTMELLRRHRIKH